MAVGECERGSLCCGCEKLEEKQLRACEVFS